MSVPTGDAYSLPSSVISVSDLGCPVGRGGGSPRLGAGGLSPGLSTATDLLCDVGPIPSPLFASFSIAVPGDNASWSCCGARPR